MPGTRPSLVWFRNDLRLSDHAAIDAAIRRGAPVIPVFIWPPDESNPWPPGAASQWWLHHSLASLDRSLRERGSALILRRRPPEETIVQLARESNAAAVYWHRQYEPGALERENRIAAALRGIAVEPVSLPGNLLFEPGSILNQSGQPFQVFTAFYKRALQQPAFAAPGDPPPHIPPPAEMPASVDLDELQLLPRIDWAAGFREAWQPGEAGAAAHLKRFLKQALAQYPDGRDHPAAPGTSRLSPHLHFGEISARQIWHAAARRQDAEPFLRQIIWREFAHHLLAAFPHTAEEPLRPEFQRFPWRIDAPHLQAWTRGLTGYPMVDAGMRELWHTGWMHNRVRMVVASFLVKHLLIPWQEGARWFWDTLVDADLPNNTLGWQWAAGCGADAAPYFRIFNPVLQAEKFDPEGAYVRRWIPELARIPAAFIHRPWTAPPLVLMEAGVSLVSGYPAPIVDHAFARKRALEALAKMNQLRH